MLTLSLVSRFKRHTRDIPDRKGILYELKQFPLKMYSH